MPWSADGGRNHPRRGDSRHRRGAKSRTGRFSVNQIKGELKHARLNRGDAAAGIFIAESIDSLPDGIGFGQVSDTDSYAVYNPADGDETPLTCALYMAKVAALASIATDSDQDLDITGAQREVSIPF